MVIIVVLLVIIIVDYQRISSPRWEQTRGNSEGESGKTGANHLTFAIFTDQNENAEQTMILEVAILDVKPTRTDDFEQAFGQAQAIIIRMSGYVSHQLQKCLENPNRYILLVNWQTLESHTEGFRQSAEYQQWRKLLHHFYDPFPTVEHYTQVST